MASKHHNPERKAWKGRSYRKGGERVRAVKDADRPKTEAELQEYLKRRDEFVGGLERAFEEIGEKK